MRYSKALNFCHRGGKGGVVGGVEFGFPLITDLVRSLEQLFVENEKRALEPAHGSKSFVQDEEFGAQAELLQLDEMSA